MKKWNTTDTDLWGITLILAAIVAGIFVANALLNWETNARAKVAASSKVKATLTPQATGVLKDSSKPVVESQTKTAENTPAAKETAPVNKEPSSKPDTAERTPTPEVKTTANPPSAQVSFKQDVAPIFQKNCNSCHGNMGGLNLKDYNSLMTTGANKPQVVSGKPQESLLIKRLEDKPIMPPAGPLTPSDIQKIKQWIADGATDN